ncbi:hypothetical protein DV113_001903 [Geotrichum candidum]|uniref:ARS-binding protein 1 N-terminal domain-containing protein n=1 Tax=Geotrichum candidum TaxID=1173061 RepID=A0A0J9YHJ3_GEOCN|nr:hypothetical protein DV454_004075 [Geotrichum candidum]KAI9210229.1 hypothetical protein DS838_004889 [Geotrichum bryndzae]KAF5114189.1 hypothetical protein DV452_003425 [Geotrichum candidum]KAF7500095.1 hypothetical protein DV113_001903 [Geotrichum candidum]KAI8131365.1 hypothetical protein DUD61_004978 [Geotrichum candidum]
MASAPSAKIIKKRQGIDNITRLQICHFVASRAAPPSTKIVKEWAESTFGRKFPQSTISTLLRSNGLQIKQAGGRGRRCRPKDAAADAEADPSCPQNKAAQKSEKTNLLISHLKLLADGRCRGRSSDHPEIELAFLEETYLMLKHRKQKITISWFHQLARQLFKDRNEPFPKNISQFLNQIYDKYYLINVVYKHLFTQLPYESMITKLSAMFPELGPAQAVSPHHIQQQLDQQQLQEAQPHQVREFRPVPHYASRTSSLDHYPESNLRSDISVREETHDSNIKEEDTQEVSQSLGPGLTETMVIPTLSSSMHAPEPPEPTEQHPLPPHVYAIPSMSSQSKFPPQPHPPKPESFGPTAGPAAHISFSLMSSFTEYQNGLDGDYNMLMDNVYIQ